MPARRFKLQITRGLFAVMNIMHGSGNVHTATSELTFVPLTRLIRIELFTGFRSVYVF